MSINGHNELQHVMNWFWLILYMGQNALKGATSITLH
jgi:hypothetical protein